MAGTLSSSSSSKPATAGVWSWRLALILGLFPLLSGLSFILAPKPATAAWGFPPPTTPTHSAYLSLVGVRDLYLAAGVLLFWVRGERRVVGWLLLLGAVVPVVDGLVALWNEATVWQVAQHWVATAVCTAVGYSLIA